MSGSFFADIGYASVNKFGEQLCGDHVELAETEAGDAVLALADGMGSGVKANILSTLTGKILATMLAGGMPVEDCVLTLADTLPVCQVRGVAYSTFTALSVSDGREVEILQYDNPHVILLRGGRYHPIPEKKNEIDGKTIYRTRLALREGDVFFAMSDGVEHAGVGQLMNFGWRRQDIIRFLESRFQANLNAREHARGRMQPAVRIQARRRYHRRRAARMRAPAGKPGHRPARASRGRHPPDVRIFCPAGQAHCLRRKDGVHCRALFAKAH